MAEKYTAATIGPIIDTLNAARKTRELWGASYLFSYLIRQIVSKMKNDKIQVLLPEFDTEAEWRNNNGAGLFPDRIFVAGDVDIYKKYYNPVLKETSSLISLWLREREKNQRGVSLPDEEVINEYLKTYFRFIQVHFTCGATDNIIKTGTFLLDSRELQEKIIPEDIFTESENPLFSFLYNINGSFLFHDGFGKNRRRFPSLIEISTKELGLKKPEKFAEIESIIESEQEKFLSLQQEKNSINSEEDIVLAFNERFGKEFRQVHKYLAIVQADGDKIGMLVNRAGASPEAIQALSIKLMAFSSEATRIVVQYGGSPVYMGGDDLFFFAPVISQQNGKAVQLFDLIKDLNNLFEENLLTYAKDELKITEVNELPSLSFGISLAYYKFPLFEAREMTSSALFDEIKLADKRNAVNLKFRKHSGQMINLFIPKSDESLFKAVNLFINENLAVDANFLNSFTHKLRLQGEVLFGKIASNDDKLSAFFENNNNENYNKVFFNSLKPFIKAIYQSGGIAENSEKEAFLYSVLRYIHFLRN